MKWLNELEVRREWILDSVVTCWRLTGLYGETSALTIDEVTEVPRENVLCLV